MRSPGLVAVAVVAFAAGVLVGRAGGQARPRMWADRVLDAVTDELPRKAHVVASIDRWEPGAETGRHRHPGPTVMVVLEGELEETRAGGTRTLHAGQGVWHEARTEHNVRNPGARPARALAVHLDPAG